MYIYREVVIFVDQFTATGAEPAARLIRMAPVLLFLVY
jgi:hypothetical protein